MIMFKEFKEKVNIDIVGFTTCEEEIEELGAENGIVKFATGERHYEIVFEKCKEMELLDLVINGMKIDFSLARNYKILVNHTEEDIKELWK